MIKSTIEYAERRIAHDRLKDAQYYLKRVYESAKIFNWKNVEDLENCIDSIQKLKEEYLDEIEKEMEK